jgi:hypothetical protein
MRSIVYEPAEHFCGGAAANSKTRVIDFNDERIAIAQDGHPGALAHTQIAKHSSFAGVANEIDNIRTLAAQCATQRRTVCFVLFVVVITTKNSRELTEFFRFLHPK